MVSLSRIFLQFHFCLKIFSFRQWLYSLVVHFSWWKMTFLPPSYEWSLARRLASSCLPRQRKRSLFQTSRFYLFAKIMLPHFSFPKSLWYLLLRKRSVFPTSQHLFCKKRFCHMFFNLCKKHSWNFSELIWLFATLFQIIRTTTPKLCVVYSTHYKCAKKLFIKTFCDG